MPASQPIQSVVKVLSVIDVVAGAPEGVSVGRLAEQLGMQSTTVHNFVRTLLGEGVLRRSVGSRYVLGPRLWNALGEATHRRDASKAEQAVRALAEVLPEATVILARCFGGEVAVTLRMSPDLPGCLQRSNRTLSPYTSASVLALLAFGDADEAEAYCRRFPFEEYGGHAWPSPAAIDAYLAECRRQGYVEAPSSQSFPVRLAVPWPRSVGAFTAIGVSVAAGASLDAATIRNRMFETLARFETPLSDPA
jgi:DNA-binding IclR family transcriptional regulator